MNFVFRTMEPEDASVIADWHYPEPYSFYDMAADKEDLQAFLDFDHWVPDTKYVVTTDDGRLVGFFEFFFDGDTVDIGLGMHPDATGKGWGADFVHAGLEFAAERFSPKQFRLAVASFNQRAIKVYHRNGFAVTREFMNPTNGGVYEFVEMVCDQQHFR